LGNPGVGGGLATALAATWGPWSVDGNLGVLAAPGVDLVNLGGGPKLLAAAGGSWRVTEALALRAEANLRPSLTAPNAVSATESPGEAALSVRGKAGEVFGWTAGLGTALTRGVGASPFRAYLGVGGTWGKGDDDPDGDGLRGSADACPRDPETVNGWRDEDGCPDALAQVVLVARDARGAPVAEVEVQASEQRARTNADGQAVLDGLSPADPVDLSAQHPHYAAWSASAQPLREGENRFDATLSLLPGSVRIAVQDAAGRPVPGATVRFLGETERDPEPVGATGVMTWALPPGAWTALATAEGYGTERADFTLAPGVFEPHDLTLVLSASKVTVTEDVVAIHEKVNFDFDKAVVLPESLPLLRQVANTLLNHPELELIEIAGHTDKRGTSSYNLKLSQRRVESVMTYLIAEGVDPSRLQAKGYGATQPLEQGDSAEAYAANRRVEFRILRSRRTRPEGE
jgi:outer membrane protein OmpA-like peptidoglycan-associated protein